MRGMAPDNDDEGWVEVPDLTGDDSGTSEYVTKSELEEMLKKYLGGGSGDGDADDAGDLSLDDDDDGGHLTLADVERIAEEKVAKALKVLAAKKPASSTKKAAPKPEVKKVVEEEPTTPNKVSWSSKIWGGK